MVNVHKMHKISQTYSERLNSPVNGKKELLRQRKIRNEKQKYNEYGGGGRRKTGERKRIIRATTGS